MIWPKEKPRIWIHKEPTDLRKGYAGLTAIVHNNIKKDLSEGDLFLFISKNQKSIKILRWDGTGLCIYCKRIAKGRFSPVWQRCDEEAVKMSRKDFEGFIKGKKRAP
jgi:transposase